MRGLREKVIVVAGGAGGLGTAASVRLGQEGAVVIVGDIQEASAEKVARLVTDAGGQGEAIPLDIGDEASVASFFDAVMSAHGGFDASLINAADFSTKLGNDTDAVDVNLEAFDHIMAVNLRGHLLVARRAIPHLVARGGGALTFTSSLSSFAGEAERVSYGIAKAGVNALVRHISSRWGKSGIRANAIAPGLIVTDSIRANLPAAFFERATDRVRTDRLGAPEDFAALAAFLLSDDSAYITGQVISLDGGTILR